eukprot:6214536-Pleurochrysis_carterae.AAC.1
MAFVAARAAADGSALPPLALPQPPPDDAAPPCTPHDREPVGGPYCGPAAAVVAAAGALTATPAPKKDGRPCPLLLAESDSCGRENAAGAALPTAGA